LLKIPNKSNKTHKFFAPSNDTGRSLLTIHPSAYTRPLNRTHHITHDNHWSSYYSVSTYFTTYYLNPNNSEKKHTSYLYLYLATALCLLIIQIKARAGKNTSYLSLLSSYYCLTCPILPTTQGSLPLVGGLNKTHSRHPGTHSLCSRVRFIVHVGETS
jgi:hypothetical protein